MLCDGDCFYTADVVSMYREVCKTHNATFTFHDTQPNPIYSYVTVTDDGSNNVIDIKEKVKISDFANTGCYCFKNGMELEHYCRHIIEAGAVQLSQDQKGEFYTSGVIKAMLEDKIPCKMLQISVSEHHVLGTPAQLKAWCGSWKHQPATRVVFGVERTLLLPDLSPIARNINYLKQLHAQGHTITLVASRSTPSARRNAITSSLTSLEVPYHTLEWTQPDADLYIDHHVVDSVQGDIDSYVGFYPSTVHCTGEHQPTPPASITSSLIVAAGVGAAIAMFVTAAVLRK